MWEDRTFTFIQRLHYFYLYLDIIHSTYNKKLKLILIKSCQLGFSRKNSIPPIEDTPFLSHRPPGYPRIIFVPDPLDIRYPQQGVQTFSGKAIAIPNKFPAGTWHCNDVKNALLDRHCHHYYVALLLIPGQNILKLQLRHITINRFLPRSNERPRFNCTAKRWPTKHIWDAIIFATIDEDRDGGKKRLRQFDKDQKKMFMT